MDSHDIRDRGYHVQRTLPIGNLAVLIQETYYGRPFPAGLLVRVLDYSNAGFRGIEARVGLVDGSREQITVNAGLLDEAQ